MSPIRGRPTYYTKASQRAVFLRTNERFATLQSAECWSLESINRGGYFVKHHQITPLIKMSWMSRAEKKGRLEIARPLLIAFQIYNA